MPDDTEFVVRPRPEPEGVTCGPDPALAHIAEVCAPRAALSQEEANKALEALRVPDAGGTKRTDGGMLRFNSGKLRMSLVPASLSRYTAAALGYGEIKYSANNWRRGGSWTSGYESLQRHLDSWREGEDIDAESGLPHLALAAFGIMLLIEFYDKGIGTDDRFRYPGQPLDALQPGRVLAFRPPPVQPGAEAGPGVGAGDAGGADPSAG